MYEIDVKSVEDHSKVTPFETTVRIVPKGERNEELMRFAVQQNTNYLIAYHNPILWMFNFSPLIVYIGRSSSSQAIVNEIITIEEEMSFSFKKASTRKHFEKKILPVLTKFVDKKIELYMEKRRISATAV